MTGNPETASQGLRDRAAHAMTIPPLPTLGHAEHRAASELIQSIVSAITANGRALLGFETLSALATHLRRIGDPSAAEEIATYSGEVLVAEGKPISAVAMFNAAGLACLDQCAFVDAQRHLSRAFELIPQGDPRFQAPAVLMSRAAVHTETGCFEEALKLLSEAVRLIELRPQAPIAEMDSLVPHEARGVLINSIGWVFLRSARAAGNDCALLRRAALALTTALSLPLDPRTRVRALGNRAEVLVRSGRSQEAERVLASLETVWSGTGQQRLLPEVYRRWAQLYAARGEIAAAVQWARRAMQTSFLAASPRQELRIVEVCVDILREVLSRASDPRHALESTGEPVVTQVLELLQSKDTYTGGNHSLRVSGLAGRIAARAAADEQTRLRRVKQIELAGLFHDFGKLFVPWCLLNKVSRLSHRDWETLRSHTTHGEELLMSLGLPDLAKVAGGHHERPDGAGYPRGVRHTTTEEAIVAVADAFEAMTSPSRFYTRPKSVSEAIVEMNNGAGTQFNAAVVRALMGAVQGHA